MDFLFTKVTRGVEWKRHKENIPGRMDKHVHLWKQKLTANQLNIFPSFFLLSQLVCTLNVGSSTSTYRVNI